MTFGNAFGLSFRGGTGYEPPPKKRSLVKADEEKRTGPVVSAKPAAATSAEANGVADKEPAAAAVP